ncbi:MULTISPECIES: LysR family transcriptional regulator [unclassified Anaeromyxobacter]|uniref:LysR family transcriptional regulator n=1 Tax=unclassified Anaeromyxobacter TaxID=2620896 RepID=UPI001F584D5D|nr:MULTISPECIES: LysR family transcriptional regulator [unclassified Anaeromyxobacter]
MDLNLLTVFEAVARSRSFSAAAKELGLPKSSVSRGVARLEGELGAQLLLRTTRQVALTTAGTALYDRAAPLLRSVQAALGEVPAQEEEPRGLLRVTAPVDLGVLFLAEVVTRYTARYPSVSVDLHLTGRVVDLVAERFDVALRVGARLQDSTLVVRKVAPIVLRLFASPLYVARRGSPRAEAELAAHDRVVFRGGAEKLRIGGAREPADASGRARIVCDDLLFARDAVRAGAGIGLLPSFVAEPDVVAGRLVRILPRHERLAGALHVVTPAAKHVPRKVSAFRDLVVELAGAPSGLLGAG